MNYYYYYELLYYYVEEIKTSYIFMMDKDLPVNYRIKLYILKKYSIIFSKICISNKNKHTKRYIISIHLYRLMLRFGISRFRLHSFAFCCVFLRSFRVNRCAFQNSVGFEIILCLLEASKNLILKTFQN